MTDNNINTSCSWINTLTRLSKEPVQYDNKSGYHRMSFRFECNEDKIDEIITNILKNMNLTSKELRTQINLYEYNVIGYNSIYIKVEINHESSSFGNKIKSYSCTTGFILYKIKLNETIDEISSNNDNNMINYLKSKINSLSLC